MAKVSVEQRIQAVQRYLNGDESVSEIAKDSGVTDRVVSDWIRRYQLIFHVVRIIIGKSV
ncbi:transposase-like protein [Lysinibacillus parviboronicapiens]|uniref:Transposase-like protein n=1 Tax=Lysinibacillus parviboronicapiens TaxID=436516 RepID=A0ABV2PEX0_9BACI